MEEAEVIRAKAAAVAVAASLGLAAEDAVVLHNSNKLALRVRPSDVLARVSYLGEDVAWSELQWAQRLADAGCSVGAVEPGVDPLVYEHDGFAVTLWVYYDSATSVSPDDYARALAQLHAGLRTMDLASPRFVDRIADAQHVAANPDQSPALADADRELLVSRLADLRRIIGTLGAAEQLLHGEPHPGNVLSTKHGPVFIDFETICRGPVEFDLAHVPEEVCRHYPGLDQELLEHCRHLVLAMVAAWRWRAGDQFPAGHQWGHLLLRALRDGPPWPTLDAMSVTSQPTRPG